LEKFSVFFHLLFEERQYCRKFAAILTNVCHLYGRTIAAYYENVHGRQTWKMERNKKTFTLERLRDSADVIKR
jgi:hypothetical protein